MFLRKSRVPLHGRTNLQYQTNDCQKSLLQGDRIDQLAMSKSKSFSTLIDQKIKRISTAQTPFEESTTFYKSVDKKLISHTLIGQKRFGHLEEIQIRKRVFVGDSNTIYNDELYKSLEESPRKAKYGLQKESLIKMKHENHAVGIQETQLVGFADNKITSEGLVDLEKVLEIRRAIRRRYANRKNFQKIFNLWDEDSNGAISVKNLHNVIHRLGININFNEARVLLASYDKDCSNDLALDEFLAMIFTEKDASNLKQVLEDINTGPIDYTDKACNDSSNKKQQLLKEMKQHDDQMIHVLDCTTINAYSLELMRKRARKILNMIQTQATCKEDFEKMIQEKVQDKNKDKITALELNTVLIDYLGSMKQKPTKLEMEGFLGMIQFGKYQQVPFAEIGRIVFDETDEQFFNRVQQRRLGPAPPQDKAIQNRTMYENPLSILDQGQEDFRQTYQNSAGMKSRLDSKLVRILEKVENTLFRQSEQAFKLYKDFDVDKDGYVSATDLNTKLRSMNILNDNEMKIFINYFDPEQKGYASFSEFHSKIRAGMTLTDNNGQQLVISNLEPSKLRNQNMIKFLPEFKRQEEISKKPFLADSESTKIDQQIQVSRPTTRFGSTPCLTNTFINFQSDPKTAMYQTTQERFSQAPQMKEKIQHDERIKKSNVQNANIKRIQEHQTKIKQQIEQKLFVEDKKELNTMQAKQLAQWTYEHKAHLKNDYI